MRHILSIHGKADRFEWWWMASISSIVAQVTGIFGGLYLISNDLREKVLAVTLLIVAVLAVWISIAVTFRRLRDRERPVWTFALSLVPFVGWVWLLIECGFLDRPKHESKKILVRRIVTDAEQADSGNRAKPGA